MATLAQLLDKLSPNPQLRGKQFEHICKWYLQNDPKYRGKLKKVWLWDEWPGRRAADAGIDLVAEDDNGDLWAIQAKAYSPEYSVKKKDVDTFISEASPKQFSYRLLIATTNLIGHHARRTMGDNDAGMVMRADLERDQLKWPSSPDKLRPATPKPKKPRPHQKQAMKAVISGFKETDRGQLIMACGTGKTLAGMFIAEKLESRRTLILLPSLSLLSQTVREWTANSARPFKFLSVCSDDTVWDEEDQWVSNTSELGFPVTTGPKDIATFLRRPGPSVLFCTYQSSPRIAEAFAMRPVPKFDLAIADEAHRCAGRVSMDFATVLDQTAIKASRRLFMTATPRYFTGRVQKAAKEADYEVASMDDEDTFGPVFHQLNFGEAIDRDLLSDYQVVIVGVDDPTYRAYAEKGTFVTTDGKEVTDARTLASHIGLAKAMRKYDLGRTITFHSRVKGARDFANDFPGVVKWMPARQRPRGSLWTDYVSGEMPSGDRDVRLDHLRHVGDGERGLLSNARCLAEGVDVPTLDGVAFVDPRRSQVDIVQAVGRAIRKAEDKTVGTIVLPVFIGDNDDPEAVLDSSAFKPVWDVLKALRAHDEGLAEELDGLRREMGRIGSGAGGSPSKVRFDLPVGVGHDFAEALKTRLVEQSTPSWEFWFGLLERFVAREGHALVLTDHDEASHHLGNWVSSQRDDYKKESLASDQVRRLEALPGWTWDVHAWMWAKAFSALDVFVDREGHARVRRTVIERGFRLGAWAADVRSRFKRGQIEDSYARRLEALPGWTWSLHESNWEVAFSALQAFTEREENCDVTRGHKENDIDLDYWISKQRSAYKVGGLSSARISRLEQLAGWVWSLRPSWEDARSHSLALLRQFAEREGHARVPFDHLEGGEPLGRWAARQSSLYRKGVLPEKDVEQLEAISGWSWTARVDRTTQEERMAALLAFVSREGHAKVPNTHTEDGVSLGGWVARLRGKYRRGELDRNEISVLEALPGWSWEPKTDSWEVMFQLLIAYSRREGHLEVPQNHVEAGKPLGTWASSQRAFKRRGDLSMEKAERLETLVGWVWNTVEAKWEQSFALLKAYAEGEGHSRVPQGYQVRGKHLGVWVNKQRQRYRAGKLSPSRVSRLEALPGWMWQLRKSKRD